MIENTEYIVANSLIVPNGITLTIDPGVSMRFIENASLHINGNLNIQGQEDALVRMTSMDNNDMLKNWRGIIIEDGAGIVSVDYALIEYVDYGGVVFDGTIESGSISNSILRHNGIAIDINDSSPNITSTIITSNSTGISIDGISAPVINGNNRIVANSTGILLEGNYFGTTPLNPVVTNNNIYDNTRNYAFAYCGSPVPKPYRLEAQNNWWGTTDLYDIEQGIFHLADDSDCGEIDYYRYLDSEGGVEISNPASLITGTLDTDLTLIANNRYLMTGWVTVPVGSTMTIEEGARIEFAGYTGSKLIIGGVLNVEGTETNPVLFTTAKNFPNTRLDQSDWFGIEISSTGVANIDHAVIEYADRGLYFNLGQGAVSNSLIKNNIHGVYISGSQAVQLLNNTITNNRYGIYLDGTISDPQPTIFNNNIYNNRLGRDINIYLHNYESTTSLNLSDNWWGTNDTALILDYIESNNGVESDVIDLGTISTEPYGSLVLKNVLIDKQYISPLISPGENDSVSFTAEMSEPGNWELKIVNSRNELIRNVHGSTNTIVFDWDGTNNSSIAVPDGVYQFIVTTISTTTKTLQYGYVIVDNTAPVADIVSPAAAVTIDELPYLQIIGTANDPNIYDYQLSYANSFTNNPAEFLLINKTKGPDPSNEVSRINSQLLTIVLYDELGGFQIQPGNKTIRLVVTDKAGNASVIYRQIVLDYPGIYDVSHFPKTINAVKGELSTISFTLGTPGTLTLRISPELGGASIYEETRVFTEAGEYSMTWNGKTTAGDLLPNEAYSFEIELSDDQNTIIYSEPRPTPDSIFIQLRSMSWFSISKNKNFSMDIYHKGMSRVTACFNQVIGAGCGDAEANPYVNYPIIENRNWYIWDGRNDSGEPMQSHQSYMWFRVQALLKPLSIKLEGDTPVISNGGVTPNISIKPTSYKVRHSYDEISSIAYQVDQDSMVTVKLLPPGIYDPSDPSAYIIQPSTLMLAESSPGVPAPHSFDWRGYNNEVPSPDTNNILVNQDGRYTFVIEATSVETDNTVIYRGNLNLFQ